MQNSNNTFKDSKMPKAQSKIDFKELGTRVLYLKFNDFNQWKQMLCTVEDEKSKEKLRELQNILLETYAGGDIKIKLWEEDPEGNYKLKIKLHNFNNPLKYLKYTHSYIQVLCRFGLWCAHSPPPSCGISIKLDTVVRRLPDPPP